MIAKTDALCLRVTPFSRTSHVVSWLTSDYGRISTVIKGAQRPKSAFLGQYDLFYSCELLFYRRERNGLHIARECTPLDTRPGFRTDWRAAACASYLSDLLSRVSPGGGHAPELHTLAVQAMDFLCEGGSSLPFLFWLELQLLAALGLAPRLAECAACDARVAPGAGVHFSARRGGVLCGRCAPTSRGDRLEAGVPWESEDSNDAVRPLPPDARAILRRLQSVESPRAAAKTVCTPRQVFTCRRIIGIFVEYYLDIPPSSRNITFELAGKKEP